MKNKLIGLKKSNRHIIVSRIILLIWAIVVFGFCLPVLLKWYGLSTRGIKIQGVVTAKEPHNHNNIHYSYKVGANTYNDFGRYGIDIPTFDKIKIGDSIIIIYDSEKPERSCCSNPNANLHSAIGWSLAIALVLGIQILFEFKRYFSTNRY